jgi:hypothetical protein
MVDKSNWRIALVLELSYYSRYPGRHRPYGMRLGILTLLDFDQRGTVREFYEFFEPSTV